MRSLGLHVFCSVKGGVGKSTLAVVTAKLLASLGRVPVVVDLDMLGASLADGLSLCAPRVQTHDGLLDLEAPPTGEWASVAETRDLRDERKSWTEHHTDLVETLTSAPPPVFLNDAFFYPVPTPGRDCCISAFLWRHERDDGVGYLPSSPLREDARRSAPFSLGAVGGFGWVRRLAWILDALLEQKSDVTDIIIDLPPGTWGFAHEIMVFVGALGRDGRLPNGYPRWHEALDVRVNPFVVTSRDRSDHVLAFEYLASVRTRVPGLRPLLNRAYEGIDALRRRVRDGLHPALRDLGIEQLLAAVPSLPSSLGQVFVDGDVAVKDRDRDTLIETLRLEAER
jgi:NUBPL iron-transfer P-loop NTPase